MIGLALPIMSAFAGVCGVGNDCVFCATQELCEAKTNCVWATTVCEFAGFVPITTGNVGSMVAWIGTIFADLQILAVVVIGLPLAFWVVRKTMSLVRAR